MKAIVPVLAPVLFLAACAPAPRPVAPPPAPAPSPAPAAVMPAPPPPEVASDWRDRPITPGDWHWVQDGQTSTARYTAPSGAAVFSMSCETPARRVILAAITVATVDEPMTVTTASQQRVLAAHPSAGSLSASVESTDPLLDAIAFSRGRFMIELPEKPALLLPSWTEVSRVIEDCR